MLCAMLMLIFLTLSKGINCLLTDHRIYTEIHAVDLSRRYLTEIPQNISKHTEILDLSHNELQIIPNDMFVNLSKIITLDLSANKINVILKDAFNGLSTIESLDLSANQLTCKSFQIESFKKLTSLKNLIISQNSHNGDSSIVFSDELYRLRFLETLVLDGDGIETDQSQLNEFKYFKSLKRLAFVGNVMAVTNKTFEGLKDSPVEELKINIKSAENNAFIFFPKLQRLTLTLNWRSVSLEKIFPALETFKRRRMTSITLSGNREVNLFGLGKSHLKYLWDICLRELYLPSNNIINIYADGFSTFAKKSTCLEVFDMSDNPLSLDGMYWWMSIPSFINLKFIRFSKLGISRLSKRSIKKTVQTNFTFRLPSTLNELYINYGSSIYGLPNVTFIDGQSMKVLNLFEMKFQDCLGSFRGIPNLIELDISGFNCTYLNTDILQILPRLEKFTAQNSFLNSGLNSVGKSGARLFAHLFNLNYVDLSSNNLKSLHSNMFNDQQKTLLYLYLGNNDFTNIPIRISKFKLLKVLDLSSNRIEYFNINDQEMLEKSSNIDIRLSGNPFACTCDHKSFLRWIKDSGTKFFVNVQCIGEDKIRRNISDVISSLDKFELNCVLTFWFYFAIIMSSVCGSIIIFLSLYYRYRSEIQYFFLKIRIRMKKYKSLEELGEYQFDAFISYSSSDSSWVTKFYRRLTDDGFNLCIDAKDFIAGDGIAENIVRAIDCSRKIIFIVTRNFMKSSWGGYEIEMTRMHAFREGRENMVVLIIKDEIPIDEMPRPLKEMWNKIVCLKYYDQDESVFYDSVTLCLR